MRTVVYLSPARRDISSIYSYVANTNNSTAAARRVIERLTAACTRLGALAGILGTQRPELGDCLRSTPCDSDIIFFRYQEDAVEIVNILHARRDIDGYFSE